MEDPVQFVPTVHHLRLQSLQEGNVFECNDKIPDSIDEHARREYMDSFILSVLPLDNVALGNYRARMTLEYLKLLTSMRYNWVTEEWLDFMIDWHLWRELFSEWRDTLGVKPEFPWTLLAPDTSKKPSDMYQSWRRSHLLDSDPAGEIHDSTSSDSVLKTIKNSGNSEHQCLWLLHDFPEKNRAYGVEPISMGGYRKWVVPSLSPQAASKLELAAGSGLSLVGPHATQPDQAIQVVASSSRALVSAAHGDKTTTVARTEQTDLTPPQFANTMAIEDGLPDMGRLNASGDDEVRIHRSLVGFWTELVNSGHWMSSRLVSQPFEMKLPDVNATNMILEQKEMIQTISLPSGISLHIKRRDGNENSASIFIDVSNLPGANLSEYHKTDIRKVWKCLVRWVTFVWSGAMIDWYKWFFLWNANLYSAMGIGLSDHEVFADLASLEQEAAQVICRLQAEHGTTSGMRRYINSLYLSARRNSDFAQDVADLLRDNAHLSNQQLLAMIVQSAEGHKTRDTPMKHIDRFSHIGMTAVYAVANSRLEEGHLYPISHGLYLELSRLVGRHRDELV